MTVTSDNKLIGRMLDLLNKLGISQRDCDLAERYLREEVDDEVLKQFVRKDLSVPSYNLYSEGWTITRQVNKSANRTVFVRFFNIIFAIGHGTGHRLFWYEALNIEEYALYKKMVTYMSGVTEDEESFFQYNEYSQLMKMAQHNPQNLIEVIPYLKEESELYAAAGLAMYFCRKYENPGIVEAEDEAYMAEYEDIVLECFDSWLAGLGCAAHEKVISTLRKKKQAGDFIGRIEHTSMKMEEQRTFCFLCTFAYLNFQLSDVLLAVIQTCAAVNAELMLVSIRYVFIGNNGCRTHFAFRGMDYDELFHIEPALYICMAAINNYDKILVRQLEKNQESYRKVMEREKCQELVHIYMRAWRNGIPRVVSEVTEDVLITLKNVMQKANPDLYEQVVRNAAPDYEPVIELLVPPTPHAELAKEYLLGNCKVSELYPYDKEFGDRFEDGLYKVKKVLDKFKKHNFDEAFIDRCRVFLILRKFPHIEYEMQECIGEKGLSEFFAKLDKEELDLAHQLQAFALLYKENLQYDNEIKLLKKCVEEKYTKFLQENREEAIQMFAIADAEARCFGLCLFEKDPQFYKQEILNYTKDSSSLVRRELVRIIGSHREWEEDVKTMLNGKKASQRELAIWILLRWQEKGADYHELLSWALENEKSGKLVTLLEKVLKIQEKDQPKKSVTKEELVKQLHQGGRKRTLAWAYETPFSPVHKTDGSIADEEYLQAIFLCYAAQIQRGMNENVQLLAADLNVDEFAVYVNELFDKWIAQGAEAKKDWVLFAASIHGKEDIVPKLYHQIQEWTKVSRGAIAAEAVMALALNSSPNTLLLVDSIARKFKHKQVKGGALRALDETAKMLGISREALDDRIVPDFGFDKNMQRTFDYGARIFKVTLTSALDLEIFDESGKKLKNLPSPGKKDDESKAVDAYAAFKEMKKQIKAAITSQKERLEHALSIKREWSTDAWTNLFVKNPLMHQFAIGLIWGIYESGKLVQSFRYMEDGSFNTQDGDAYTLQEGVNISLVHPVELSETEKKAWKEQLADYETIQPIEQLDRDVYRVMEDEKDTKRMERFGGSVLNDFTLDSKLANLGWYRGVIGDAGSYNTYHRKDAEVNMGVELHFSGSCVGWHQGDVTVYDARFYEAKSIGYGSYGYVDADKKEAFLLQDVSPRYFSEIVRQLTKATASSDEQDTDWKKEAGLTQ
ncbi:MAG TPA: DUF4132 domain-containing protein [Lachnospiraceae bacterium]|nr:DUF4132 domain-containing protein [Lachnospiraceae bacterium]